MSKSRSMSSAGRSPARTSSRTSGALRGSAALLTLVTLGACSTGGELKQSADWYPLQPAGTTSLAPPALRAVPLVEVEGDGLLGQRPPRRRTSEVPDDPSEPYSPNYGTAPTAPQAGAPLRPA